MKKIYICLSVFLALGAWIGLRKIEPPHFSGWTEVTVQPGQYEWSLSQVYCPKAETFYVVDAIEHRNHTDGNIKPGEILWVPTASIR